MRPLAAMILAGLLMRRSGSGGDAGVLLAVAWWMPVSTSIQPRFGSCTVRETSAAGRKRLRAAGGNEVAGSRRPAGLYVDTDSTMWHPIYYYFRGLGPWTRQLVPAPEILDRNLHDPASFRPSLVQEDRYREYLHGPEAARFTGGPSPPMISIRPRR